MPKRSPSRQAVSSSRSSARADARHRCSRTTTPSRTIWAATNEPRPRASRKVLPVPAMARSTRRYAGRPPLSRTNPTLSARVQDGAKTARASTLAPEISRRGTTGPPAGSRRTISPPTGVADPPSGNMAGSLPIGGYSAMVRQSPGSGGGPARARSGSDGVPGPAEAAPPSGSGRRAQDAATTAMAVKTAAAAEPDRARRSRTARRAGHARTPRLAPGRDPRRSTPRRSSARAWAVA